MSLPAEKNSYDPKSETIRDEAVKIMMANFHLESCVSFLDFLGFTVPACL